MRITNYARQWFARADDDLRSAEVLSREGSPNAVCFHAQQCAEKYLKGFLAANEKHVRKIHDLPELLAECVKLQASFTELREDIDFLNQFYLKARYADDFREFSKADAQRALAAAARIKEFVVSKIK